MNKYQKALSRMAKNEMKVESYHNSYRLAKKRIQEVLSKDEVIGAYQHGITMCDIFPPIDYSDIY